MPLRTSIGVALTIILVYSFFVKEGHAAAGDDLVHVGHTTSVVKDVHGQIGSASERRIVNADKVFFNENLITSDDSVVVVQFRDGSTLELGPNGLLTLDEMVFNPVENENFKAVTLLQGSFRYISGFVVENAAINITTPVGTIGIRGSTGSGFVYPGTPTFLHISKGDATFTNDSGTTSLSNGDSIASDSADSPPMDSNNFPAPVAAEALSHIESTFGSADNALGTQALSPEMRAADAAANAIPVALQGQQQAVATDVIAPTVVNVPGLPLLTGASDVGLLQAGATDAPSAEQQSFLAQAAQANPNAEAEVAAITAADQSKNAENVTSGTSVVVTGSSENAESEEQIEALIQATVSANPDGANIAAAAAIVGGSANENVESMAGLAQTVASGAVAGAVDAGVDVAAIMQATTQGAIVGAVESGADTSEVIQGSTKGAMIGAADAGLDVATVTQAATQGAISGAIDAGIDVQVITMAVAETVNDVAADLDLEQTEIAAAVLEGAVDAATEAGLDPTAITETIVETISDEPAQIDIPQESLPAEEEEQAPPNEQQDNASPS